MIQTARVLPTRLLKNAHVALQTSLSFLTLSSIECETFHGSDALAAGSGKVSITSSNKFEMIVLHLGISISHYFNTQILSISK